MLGTRKHRNRTSVTGYLDDETLERVEEMGKMIDQKASISMIVSLGLVALVGRIGELCVKRSNSPHSVREILDYLESEYQENIEALMAVALSTASQPEQTDE